MEGRSRAGRSGAGEEGGETERGEVGKLEWERGTVQYSGDRGGGGEGYFILRFLRLRSACDSAICFFAVVPDRALVPVRLGNSDPPHANY